jgi:hypothetical protein
MGNYVESVRDMLGEIARRERNAEDEAHARALAVKWGVDPDLPGYERAMAIVAAMKRGKNAEKP